MGLDHDDDLSFFNLVELMTKIGYIESFEDNEKDLLATLWTTLVQDTSLNCDAAISQRNLVVFLCAVDNIYLE